MWGRVTKFTILLRKTQQRRREMWTSNKGRSKRGSWVGEDFIRSEPKKKEL